MKKCLASLIVLVIAYPVCAQPKVTTEEYGIYSLVLRNFVREYRRGSESSEPMRFLILSKTKSDNETRSKRSDPSVYRSFDLRNKQTAEIQPRFAVNFDYLIADESEILTLIEKATVKFEAEQERRRAEGKPLLGATCGPGWGEFFAQRFPNTLAYVGLSRIGFSRDHRSAYVEIEHTVDSGGGLDSYLLRWTSDGWNFVEVGRSRGIC